MYNKKVVLLRRTMFQKVIDIYNKSFIFILVGVILLLAYYSYLNRFVQDDAFISLRYAFNMVHDHGLVWNIGERVEGYSNFLWVIILTIPLYFTWDPVYFIYATGPILMIIMLVAAFKLSECLFESKNIALVTIILLGINFTFSCFATSGMETALQTSLALICYVIFIYTLKTKKINFIWMLIFSFVFAMALLTRLDSLILISVPVLGLLITIIKFENKKKYRLKYFLAIFLPVVIIMLSYFVFKYYYYHSLVPNTYYLKFDGVFSFDLGAFYLYSFFKSYYLLILLVMFVLSLYKFFNKDNISFIAIFITVILWFLYVIKIGGDFIEFRLFVPVLPYIFILFNWFIFRFLNQKVIVVGLIIFIILGNYYHRREFHAIYNHFWIEPVKQLKARVLGGDLSWINIGKQLGYTFNYDPEIKMATIPAGAISFYSELSIIDLLGLNDEWIAKNGIELWAHPSHRRIATLEYLYDRNTNLIFMAETIRKDSEFDDIEAIRDKWKDFLKLMINEQYTFNQIPQIIEIKLDYINYITVLYFHKSKNIDEIILKKELKTYSLFEENESHIIYED